MELKKLIGARIKDIRTKKEITQEQLSEKMGINPKYLSSIERGKENPTLNTIINLSESLEINIDEIFTSLPSEEPKHRKAYLRSLLKEANDEQLKLAAKIISAIVH